MNGRDAATIRGYVSGLSRPERLILLLHYADGLNVGEIAAVLDTTDRLVTETLAQLRREARRLVGRAGVLA